MRGIPRDLGLLLAKEFETATAPSESHLAHTLVSMAPFPRPIAIKFSLTRGVIEMLNFTDSISSELISQFA